MVPTAAQQAASEITLTDLGPARSTRVPPTSELNVAGSIVHRAAIPAFPALPVVKSTSHGTPTWVMPSPATDSKVAPRRTASGRRGRCFKRSRRTGGYPASRQDDTTSNPSASGYPAERTGHAILRIDDFPLSLRAVHGPEQAGEMFGVDRRHLPDRLARRSGLLHLGVEGTVPDGCADVEHADVDALLGYLGVQGLQVVALGGLCGTGTAHVRQALHGAAALRGQDGAVPLLEHVRQELLHEGQHRVEDQRHEALGVLWGQVGCGNEPGLRGGRIVKGVEVARLSANPLGQPGRGAGVGQVGCDDVRGCPGTGQILRQTVQWLRAAAHQRDGVTLPRVATGDSLAEAGSGSEHSDGFGHKNAPIGSPATTPNYLRPHVPRRQVIPRSVPA